ncbi:hypothetical protein WDW89_26365 [Deltaproteobacteria bacterium TL4]
MKQTGVRITKADINQLKQRVKAAGAVYCPYKRAWMLEEQILKKLGLSHRILRFES